MDLWIQDLRSTAVTKSQSISLPYVPAFTQVLHRPLSDVTNELLRLSQRPDQVPSARVQLLMAACGLRLLTANMLLKLLPLTGVPSYVAWFRRAAHMLIGVIIPRSSTAQEVARLHRVKEERLRLTPSLVAGFKIYLRAHPDHLGLYAIMDCIAALRDAVFADVGCAVALAALPETLFATVRDQHGGVLTPSLWDVAMVACITAAGTPQAVAHLFTNDRAWRPLLRICLLQVGLPSLRPELLFLHALPGIAVSCHSRQAITPYLLHDLIAGPYKDLVPHLEMCFKRLLKGARAERRVEPVHINACISFCNVLNVCENLEGVNGAVDPWLQCLATGSMEEVRGSALGALLREVRVVTGAAGGGCLARAIKRWAAVTMLGRDGNAALPLSASDIDAEMMKRQAQADKKSFSRLYSQVSMNAARAHVPLINVHTLAHTPSPHVLFTSWIHTI